MARYATIGTTFAATALIALPVLAQTHAPGSAPPPPSADKTMATPAAPAPGSAMATHPGTADTSAAANTDHASKYFTADHQVRTSKLVGASVYNDQKQSIGSIDDVLMSATDHKVATAVISVGGFLGLGSKLVSVPFDQLQIENDRVVLPGATKASLEGMPEYHYTSA
jgi:sporulation protein YlmC with PRC-barrel domain